MTVLRDFAKAILRSTGKLSPRIARFSLRLFAANDNLFLRAANLMSITDNLEAIVQNGPLKGLRFSGLLLAEIDPLLLNQMEPVLSETITKMDLRDQIAIDVGASYGYYSLLLSRCVGDFGLVYAFEPDPDSLLRLARNLELNHVRNVTLLPYALSDNTHADLWTVNPNEPWDNKIVSPAESAALPNLNTRPIVSIPIDIMLESFRGKRIALIKIDVEGSEVSVLRGAEKLLQEHRPTIVIELHSADLATQTFQILSLYGYRWDTVEFKGDHRHHVIAVPTEDNRTSQK